MTAEPAEVPALAAALCPSPNGLISLSPLGIRWELGELKGWGGVNEGCEFLT